MHREGFSLEQISQVAKLGVEEIETIIKKKRSPDKQAVITTKTADL